MKLVIDIPEEIYQNAKTDMLCGSEVIVNAIKNGIPQEPKTDVLDKIKAEIMDFEEDIFHSTKDYSDYAAVRHCVDIIDKYRQEVEE